jgi:hypothetical protein
VKQRLTDYDQVPDKLRVIDGTGISERFGIMQCLVIYTLYILHLSG